MSSSRYLELLKLKQTKLLKVVDLYESGSVERSDFVNKSLSGSANVSCNHSKEAVSKLSFNSDLKLECPNKSLIKLRDLFCNKYLVCSAPNCGYKSRFPYHMARHELVHSGVKPFKCRRCNFATNQKSSLKEHQVTKHWKGTGCKDVFVCEFEECSYPTALNFHATEHRRRHLKIKPFKCHHPDCGLSFVSKGCLQKHKVVHAKKKRFRCTQKNCNFANKYRFYLRSHQDIHSSVRAFKCPRKSCSYAAKQISCLRNHLRNHSEAKPYKCAFNGCSFATKYKHNFRNHTATHEDVKEFNCDFKHCNYGSNCKHHLKAHLAVHSEVRPFKCDYKSCNYAAKRKTSLVRHKKSHERKGDGKGDK